MYNTSTMDELHKVYSSTPALQTICGINVYNKTINEDAYYAYKNLADFSPSTNNKETAIPRLMHYIWFTRDENPKQIPEGFLANLQLELNKLKIYNLESPVQWRVKLWINYKECIAPTLEIIAEMGYPVEIMIWQDENFSNSRSILQNKVTELISIKNAMGAAYDIARFMIAEKYAGFLPDLDYNTGNSTEIIVQRGYHSVSSFEIDYIGFGYGHRVIECINDYTLDFVLSIKKHNFSLTNLSSYQFAGIFSYGTYTSFAEFLLQKEDLFFTPQCSICDLEPTQSDNSLYSIYNEDEILGLCLVNPPAICIEAESQPAINSTYCILVINDSGIDFGGKNALEATTWNEDWQLN